MTNYLGSIVGVQLRSLYEKNYDTFLLRRRPESHFFGFSTAIHHMWRTGEVWLVEGPFDHLILERLISPSVLAITTSSLSTSQNKSLKRFVKKIYTCLDIDKAGKEGSANIRDYFGESCDVISVDFSMSRFKVKDVNELWKKLGDSGFKRKIYESIGVEYE